MTEGDISMKTAVVTDSNCGISIEEAKGMNVFIIPMPVYIQNDFHYEGVDLHPESFLMHLKDREEVHTSQPSPADLMSMWEKVLFRSFDELVYIPMSSGLSGSFHTACQMAMEFPGKVYVADARRISVTQRHAVQDALWLASRGMDASTIKERLERNALNSVVFVGVDDIDYLKRGGRITSAAATMASVLNIKPLLIIGGNRIDAYEKVRGQKCCEKRLLKAIQEKAEQFERQGVSYRIGIAGSFTDEADLACWYAQAKETFPDEELVYDPLTCSISSYVGPNSFGMGISAKIDA